MRRPVTFALAALVAQTAGCERRPDVGPVVVSAIGTAPGLVDPRRRVLSPPERMLLAATTQGLVRFDAAGQIEPGLAERWIVIDDGTSYIFRLRAARWSDGRPVLARDVVTILKRHIAASSGNPLRPFLTAIDDIVEMTPEVIEIRLSRPRPDLLKLFAQPELAILRLQPPGGSGPYRATRGAPAAGLLLRPVDEPDRAADEVREPSPEENVQLLGERAAIALLRFADRKSDLVAGGTFADWPLTRLADIAPANIRLDPAVGLFGLAVVDRSGFLADPANRAAVAQAIDRAALTSAFAEEWQPAERLLPEQLDSAAAPAEVPWSALPFAERRADAARRVAAWRAAHDDAPATLRLALPGGPGGTMLWGRLAADLLAIGITPVRAGWRSSADLRLIDAVAPYDSARWYLATACDPCGEEAAAAVEAARVAMSPTDRAQAIARADAAVSDDIGFVMLARPFRWSLVSLRLRAWQPNTRAWHPLNRLRVDPN